MRKTVRFVSALIVAIGLVLLASIPVASAQGAHQSEDEISLEASDDNAMQIRRKLFSARQRGDTEKIKELEKKFKKAQDERVRLLRKTWQM